MMIKTLTKKASMAGIYRCRGLGQTKNFKEGEVFEPCSCCTGEVTWEYWLDDNIRENDGFGYIIEYDADIGIVGNIIVVKDSLKEGDILNLKGNRDSLSERYNGLYKIKRHAILYPPVPFRERCLGIIWVERIRDVDKLQPLHKVDLYLIYNKKNICVQ